MSSTRTRARSSPRRSSRSSRRRSGIGTRKPEAIPPVIVVFGPTAVGKTDLLASLFDSRFEIISADSMQVYRGMDIGTAKPLEAVRARLPHHLIDVADPREQYNAGRFVKDAETLIRDIGIRGRASVVSGGTAFYVTSLLYGLPESPPVDPGARERLRALHEREGQAAMHRLLGERDPEAAARIQPNDRYRTMRALEVLESTRRSLFSFGWPRTPRSDMRFLLIGLQRPRADLYRRIEERVAGMFERGLVGEVKRLLAEGYTSSDPGMRGIGYRQLLDMRVGCETLVGVRDRIARDTRRYAKRQLTFFRSVPGVSWVDVERPDDIMALVVDFLAADALRRATPGTGAADTNAPGT